MLLSISLPIEIRDSRFEIREIRDFRCYAAVEKECIYIFIYLVTRHSLIRSDLDLS